jgi:hypothetical protein
MEVIWPTDLRFARRNPLVFSLVPIGIVDDPLKRGVASRFWSIAL